MGLIVLDVCSANLAATVVFLLLPLLFLCNKVAPLVQDSIRRPWLHTGFCICMLTLSASGLSSPADHAIKRCCHGEELLAVRLQPGRAAPADMLLYEY